MSTSSDDLVAEVAFQDFVQRYSAPSWKRLLLDLVQQVILDAARQSFPHLLNVQVLLQGSFAQHTEVWDSDGDFVLASYDMAPDGRPVPHAMSRAERRTLKSAIDNQFQVDADTWTLLASTIFVNAITFQLEHHPASREPEAPHGECSAADAERHIISFDIVADKTRFSRSAGTTSSGPAWVLSTGFDHMRRETGALSAIKAIKVLMRKCPHSFPKISGTHVEALVLERLDHHRRSCGHDADPGGLALLLMVLRKFHGSAPEGELQGSELDLQMRDYMPFQFGVFMTQGNIECWQNSARSLLRRYTSLASASDCNAWLLHNAVPPVASSSPAPTPVGAAATSSTSWFQCALM